jgi:hypothetical protein
MKTIQEKCKACRIIFIICLAISAGLIVGGFFVPPKGVIDGSVLKGSGVLLGYAALAVAMHALRLGYDLKVSHGDTALEINND